MRNLFFFFLMFCASVPGWCYKFDKSKYYCSEGGKIMFTYSPEKGSYGYFHDGSEKTRVDFRLVLYIDGACADANIFEWSYLSSGRNGDSGDVRGYSGTFSVDDGTEIDIFLVKTTSFFVNNLVDSQSKESVKLTPSNVSVDCVKIECSKHGAVCKTHDLSVNHELCNVCIGEGGYGKEDCIQARCEYHGAIFCKNHGVQHISAILSHGNGTSHTKCVSTEAEKVEFETPEYCDWCEEFICSICRPDYHKKCGKCFNEDGTGKPGCIEATCSVHKVKFCSNESHNPKHWVGTLTHQGVNDKTTTHTQCFESMRARDDFQSGNLCDYCGEVDCPVCHYFDHSKCNKCINEGGSGLLDCTKTICEVHQKEFCSAHSPNHWYVVLDCGFAKHKRCFSTKEESEAFMKVELCDFCSKIKCPVCLGHDKCKECVEGEPCTPVKCPYCDSEYCRLHHYHKTVNWSCDGEYCTTEGQKGKSHYLCASKADEYSRIGNLVKTKCGICRKLICPVCEHKKKEEPEKECPEKENCVPVQCAVCNTTGCEVHNPHFPFELECGGIGGKNSVPVKHRLCFKSQSDWDRMYRKFKSASKCTNCGVFKCPECGHSCACPNTTYCDVSPCNKIKPDGTYCRASYCHFHGSCPECGTYDHDVGVKKCPNLDTCKLVICNKKKVDGSACGEKYCSVHRKHTHSVTIGPDGEKKENVLTVPVKDVEETERSFDGSKYGVLKALKDKLLPDFSFLKKSGASGAEVLTFHNVGLEGVYTTDIVLDISDPQLNPLRTFTKNLSRFSFALLFAWLVILALRQW